MWEGMEEIIERDGEREGGREGGKEGSIPLEVRRFHQSARSVPSSHRRL